MSKQIGGLRGRRRELLLLTSLLLRSSNCERSAEVSEASIACQDTGICRLSGDIGGNSLLQASMGGPRKVTVQDDIVSKSSISVPLPHRESAHAMMPSTVANTSEISLLANIPEISPSAGLSGFSGDVVVTVAAIVCGQSVFAPSGKCPAECPFFAEEAGKPCFFQCVSAAECGSLIPENRIADTKTMNCRPCKIAGCSTCAFGPLDACAECASGYVLDPLDGTCRSTYVTMWTSIFSVVGVLAVVLLIWYVQLLCAPVTNPEGLEEGLAYRSNQKLHIPKGDEQQAGVKEGSARQLWPLSTNLHAAKVAGPGLTLHWNFQFACIAWACLMVAGWTIYAYWTYPAQLLIGLMHASTPDELCSVTLVGRNMQQTMMRSKALFIMIAYVATFLGCMAYAVMQQQVFEKIADDTTMDDYAALLTGLPELSGEDPWEDKLQKFLQDHLGQQVVGVSICWNYGKVKTDVGDALEAEQVRLLGDPAPKVQDDRNFARKAFGQIDKLLGFTYSDSTATTPKSDEEMTELLKSMVSTNSAFVVFETEAARDAAVAAVQESNGIAFQETRLMLEREVCEPCTVKWDSFDVTTVAFTFRLVLGIFCIAFALLLWVVVFYLPYAYYSSTFSYSHGEEPGYMEIFVFSMVVVIGNQVMYQICGTIADRVGFRFRDRAEGLYILLYFTACTLNVMADMSVEFLAGYRAMVGAHVHTADGRLLETLSDFEEIFEAYPIQKVLGARLFAYCFPSTFLIPFLVEPIFSIFLPYHLCKLLVRTHPEVRGRAAEQSMDFFAPMDMARYGDILLNLMLVSFIFFFPSGTILKLYLAFIACHIYVYLYDQYRVLRAVPAFCYSSNAVDRYAQAIMAIPCATLASCLIFKANCVDDSYCLKGLRLLWACGIAFFCHLLFHYACLFLVVPLMSRFHEHVQTEESYTEAAGRIACTWFSANPVHCLRSKYIYSHTPPCSFWIQGKEHLMVKNPDIGVYFEDKSKPISEEYEFMTSPLSSWRLRRGTRHKTS